MGDSFKYQIFAILILLLAESCTSQNEQDSNRILEDSILLEVKKDIPILDDFHFTVQDGWSNDIETFLNLVASKDDTLIYCNVTSIDKGAYHIEQIYQVFKEKGEIIVIGLDNSLTEIWKFVYVINDGLVTKQFVFGKEQYQNEFKEPLQEIDSLLRIRNR